MHKKKYEKLIKKMIPFDLVHKNLNWTIVSRADARWWPRCCNCVRIKLAESAEKCAFSFRILWFGSDGMPESNVKRTWNHHNTVFDLN